MHVAIMSANRAQRLSSASEGAVSETVKQISAKALELLTRRNEINRRIGFLNNVMKGLQNVPTKTTHISWDLPPTASACAMEAIRSADSTKRRRTELARIASFLRGPTRHVKGELTRACRIALVEADGRASIDEIRRRIVRRESFLFADPGSAKAAIHKTLKAMTDSGEVRRLDDGSNLLWLRNAPEWDGDRKAVRMNTAGSQPGENTNTLPTVDVEAI